MKRYYRLISADGLKSELLPLPRETIEMKTYTDKKYRYASQEEELPDALSLEPPIQVRHYKLRRTFEVLEYVEE